ncbi:MAG TPA: hypothetical protein VGR00_05675, partial [Thermoanaerobaculia bacterium]|nr:hypothetical protein [Thermoanaerobaculia bacterium]
TSGWPSFDPAFAVDATATVAVQVNGKTRGSVEVPRGAAVDAAVEAALKDPLIAKWLEGKERVKTIYVPDRLLNFVVR